MKAFSLMLAVLLGAMWGLSGCESDVPPAPSSQIPNKLERGITGQGTLYQPDRTSDPVIRETSRVGY